MAGRLSDDTANNMLDAVFAGVALTGMPSPMWLAMSTTLPGSDGSNVTEPTDSAYERVSVAKNSTQWPTASGRQKVNGVLVSFPAPSISGSGYGDVGWIAIYDAATGGTFYGFLIVSGGPQAIGPGVEADFNPGDLIFNAPAS